MDFHILTLFPDVMKPYFACSILGRALDSGLIRIFYHQLRDYTTDKHHKVDDAPYGGGAGMIFKADVLVPAVRDIRKKHPIDRVILLSPRGKLFSQAVAKEYSSFHSILLICGRYEGVDERAIELAVDCEISIGDYVITGGELAAQIVVDATARLIPGVVGNEAGPLNESHADGFLEYPQYTRPEEFEGKKVQDVL
ncbi:MAG: tRNA (guanosine(37)-N1)-methyltransferase TrmD, partial [Deltaproteobacteria bacterium]|nr:tRNA (guanosine(37)-N1)-methyltransferase TrmD [Deltaproteobacteria bacterium]